MTLTLHEMDHFPDDILNCGPLTALWEFVTERSVGDIVRSFTSQLYPFSQLANTLIQREQLNVVQMKYPDLRHSLEYAKPRRNWDVISRPKRRHPYINDRIALRTPRDDQYRLQQNEKVAITVYFKNYLELKISPQRLSKYISDVVHWWGKIRIKGDSETVYSEWAQRNLNEKHRTHRMQGYVNQDTSYLTLDKPTIISSS